MRLLTPRTELDPLPCAIARVLFFPPIAIVLGTVVVPLTVWMISGAEAGGQTFFIVGGMCIAFALVSGIWHGLLNHDNDALPWFAPVVYIGYLGICLHLSWPVWGMSFFADGVWLTVFIGTVSATVIGVVILVLFEVLRRAPVLSPLFMLPYVLGLSYSEHYTWSPVVLHVFGGILGLLAVSFFINAPASWRWRVDRWYENEDTYVFANLTLIALFVVACIAVPLIVYQTELLSETYRRHISDDYKVLVIVVILGFLLLGAIIDVINRCGGGCHAPSGYSNARDQSPQGQWSQGVVPGPGRVGSNLTGSRIVGSDAIGASPDNLPPDKSPNHGHSPDGK